MSRLRRITIYATTIAMLVATTPAAQALVYDFNGGGDPSGTWATPGDWDLGANYPGFGVGDTALLGNAGFQGVVTVGGALANPPLTQLTVSRDGYTIVATGQVLSTNTLTIDGGGANSSFILTAAADEFVVNTAIGFDSTFAPLAVTVGTVTAGTGPLSVNDSNAATNGLSLAVLDMSARALNVGSTDPTILTVTTLNDVGTSAITLANNSTLTITDTITKTAGGIAIGGGSTLTLTANPTDLGAITGTGTLDLNGATYTMKGTDSIADGVTLDLAGTLNFINDERLAALTSAGTVDVAATRTLTLDTVTAANLGNVTGAGTLALGAGYDMTGGGTIADTLTVNVTGGTWKLNGAQAPTGLNNTSTIDLNNKTLTLATVTAGGLGDIDGTGGGTLDLDTNYTMDGGDNIAANLTLNLSAQLTLDSSQQLAVLTSTGTIVVGAGNTLTLDSVTPNDLGTIQGGGTLKLNAGAVMTIAGTIDPAMKLDLTGTLTLGNPQRLAGLTSVGVIDVDGRVLTLDTVDAGKLGTIQGAGTLDLDVDYSMAGGGVINPNMMLDLATGTTLTLAANQQLADLDNAGTIDVAAKILTLDDAANLGNIIGTGGGTLDLDKTYALIGDDSIAANLTLDLDGAATLTLGGTQELAGLQNDGIVALNGNTLTLSATPGKLGKLTGIGTLDLDASYTMVTVVDDIAPGIALDLAGAATLTMADNHALAALTNAGIVDLNSTSLGITGAATLGTISDTGAAGTLTLNGLSNLTANSDITVNRILVASGGQLSGVNGAGTITTTTITFNSGSFHKPGNSIGTQAFTGPIDYNGGSQIWIEVGNSSADKITATGDITFNADGDVNPTKIVLIDLGAPTANASFTIMTAGGTLKDTGGTLPSGTTNAKDNEVVIGTDLTIETAASSRDLILDSATISGTSKALAVTVATGQLLASDGSQSNDIETLSALVTLTQQGGSIATQADALLTGIDGLEDDEREHALRSLQSTGTTAGTVHSLYNVAQFSASTFGRTSIVRNAKALGSNGTAADWQMAKSDPELIVLAQNYRLNRSDRTAWMETFGNWIDQDEQGELNGYSAGSFGFNIGTDLIFEDRLLMGFSAGGVFTDAAMKAGLGRSTADTFAANLYGSLLLGACYLSGNIGYATTAYTSDRPVFNGATFDNAHGNHNADTVFSSFEMGEDLDGIYGKMTPFLGMQYISLQDGSYAETGTTNGMSVRANSTQSFLQTLGARFNRTIPCMGGWIVRPSLEGAWVHDYGDSRVWTTGTFNFDTGGVAPVALAGYDVPRDRARLGFGFDAQGPGRCSFYGKYTTEFVSGWSSHMVVGGLELIY